MLEYDLEERTSTFGVGSITFAKTVPRNQITNSLVDQLVRSGTSVGANYCEANESVSKKDFKHRIAICAKEAKELRLIFAAIKRNCSTSKDV